MCLLDKYLEKYNDLKHLQIFFFDIGYGGIGDNIKYFTYLLQLCIKNNHKIKYVKNNIPLENYLKLKNNIFYISKEEFENIKKTKKKNEYSIRYPGNFYYKMKYSDLNIKHNKLFYFTNEILNNANFLLQDINKYISVHLRLGDKYLETPKEFIQAKDNTRKYFEYKINKYIEENIKNNNIIFFCDNQKFKNKIKEKFKDIIILNTEIGHTSLRNTNKKQILDAVTEFYIITNSDKVVACSESGFSIIASKFNGIELKKLY